MPMGLTNAPEIFMGKVNNPLVDILDKRVVVFLDDVLIYGTTLEVYCKLPEKVFTNLHKHMLYHKQKKCSFLQKTTNSVAFDITLGMYINNSKITSLKEWPKPISKQ